MEGKTARGASSPAKPAFTRPEPLSHTRAVVSSSSHMVSAGVLDEDQTHVWTFCKHPCQFVCIPARVMFSLHDFIINHIDLKQWLCDLMCMTSLHWILGFSNNYFADRTFQWNLLNWVTKNNHSIVLLQKTKTKKTHFWAFIFKRAVQFFMMLTCLSLIDFSL